jgi:hypothetical protein
MKFEIYLRQVSESLLILSLEIAMQNDLKTVVQRYFSWVLFRKIVCRLAGCFNDCLVMLVQEQLRLPLHFELPKN